MDSGFTRRAALLTASSLVGAAMTAGAASGAVRERRLSAQSSWTLPTTPVPVREGTLEVGGARLWYWDTGGDGLPVILLHAATGSGAVWGYQQPVFVKAGLRVIGYSRRGHYRSEVAADADAGTSTGDLHRLADHLGLDRFALIGSALGGYTATDYAISHPDRVHAIILASTMAGIAEEDYVRQTAALTPAPWMEMPASFRELGPSYRAAFPEGVAAWEALERIARPGPRVTQKLENHISWQALGTIAVPSLFLTGDADLYMPPARARAVVSRMRDTELLIVPDCGHSAYWEQPDAFNDAVLGFLKGIE